MSDDKATLTKRLDCFDWMMLQSKIPYRSRQECMEMAWFACAEVKQAQIDALTAELAASQAEVERLKKEARREE